MKIFRLVYGNTTLPDSAIFYGGNKELKIPIVFAVYLVDTGDGISLWMRAVIPCPAL